MRELLINKILADRSFRISGIITLVFLILGILFLEYGLIQFGWVLFVGLPVVIGIAIGALPKRRLALYGLYTTLVLFLISLIFLGIEGLLCVLMALPIIIPFLFLGSVFTHLYKRYREIKTDFLKVVITPLVMLFAMVVIEKIYDQPNGEFQVKSEIILDYSPFEVFDAIKSVDTLIAEQPILLRLGLPVPYKCILEKEEVGGLRTCLFEDGKIVERITEIQKGRVLKMDVLSYELLGRSWLGFTEALYIFEEMESSKTKLTRLTTYTSELKPRFYWSFFEEMGIEQEHEFVFRNLSRDLNDKLNSQR